MFGCIYAMLLPLQFLLVGTYRAFFKVVEPEPTPIMRRVRKWANLAIMMGSLISADLIPLCRRYYSFSLRAVVSVSHSLYLGLAWVVSCKISRQIVLFWTCTNYLVTRKLSVLLMTIPTPLSINTLFHKHQLTTL